MNFFITSWPFLLCDPTNLSVNYKLVQSCSKKALCAALAYQIHLIHTVMHLGGLLSAIKI